MKEVTNEHCRAIFGTAYRVKLKVAVLGELKLTVQKILISIDTIEKMNRANYSPIRV